MKKGLWGAAVLAAAVIFVGCGAKENAPLNRLDVEQYVTLGDYNSIVDTLEPVEIEESLRDELALAVYNQYVTKDAAVTDRAVKMGDTVNIDYEGKKDDVAFVGGTAAGALLAIGSGQFIPGFEDGLVGVMPGETVDLNISFPEGYGNAELAGQPVVFTVTVNFICPTLDQMQDSAVPNIGIEGVNTVDELRQYANDYLYSNLLSGLQDSIVDELLAVSTFHALPEDMVEAEKAVISKSLDDTSAEVGATPDQYANYYYGMSADEFVAGYAEENIKRNLVFQAIANIEGLTVSDEELQDRLEEYSAAGGYASVEEFIGELTEEDFRNYFMNEKVLSFFVDRIQGQ